MKVHNDDGCPTDTTFSLQLPKTSFLSEMILTEETSNCTFAAKFMPAKQAQAVFNKAITVIVSNELMLCPFRRARAYTYILCMPHVRIHIHIMHPA